LQRKCACGGAAGISGKCEECSKKKRFGLQTKLKVNKPGDIYEQEADRIADQVMSTPVNPTVSVAPSHVPRSSGRSNGQMDAAPASVDEALASPGRPLEPTLRKDMEQRFGHDFSRVRVHSGADAEQSAQDVNAKAYTVGQKIVFGAGRYASESGRGRLLLAHELAHVVQQAGQPGILQRLPIDSPSSSIRLGPLDLDLGPLRTAEGALDMLLSVMHGVPLTPAEMYELLLVRRAEPLSIPATQVNDASKMVEELDTRIRGLDKQIRDLDAEVKTLQDKQKHATGFPKDMIRRQLSKLQTESNQLRLQRRNLLREKMRLQRGQALGTVGKGAPTGTGQITYAGIQVVDAGGRRIALEFAETSSTQHAEESIVQRMRANLKSDQLKGARITIVVDQLVCNKRCQRALRAFGQEFDVESIEAKYFVRPKINEPGEASPRTTLRTATKASSVDLPLREVTEPIYRRPSSGPQSDQPPIGVTPVSPPTSTQDTKVLPGTTGPDDTVTSRASKSPVVKTPPPIKPTIPPIKPTMTGMASFVGRNLVVDLILDIVGMKFKEWQDDETFKERLTALVWSSDMLVTKMSALSSFLGDPWFTGTSGWYYNIQLRIEVGGFVAGRVGGSDAPRPYLEAVRISREDIKWMEPVKQSVKVPTVKEGSTGPVALLKSKQYVIYSEPL